MENQFGRTSICSLRAEKREGKTQLAQISFTAPFKIMSPFYDQSEWMRVMLLSASAGIMEGDVQEFDIQVGKDARMSFSAQAYEKIHKMREGRARRKASLTVEEGGALDYHSQPVIPFAQSAFSSTLEARLADESALFCYEEILSCGRTAYGEAFDYRLYQNLVEVRRADKLIYRDNCFFTPKTMDMEGIGMYEGYHHCGTFLLFGKRVGQEQIEKIRKKFEEDTECEGGITRISDLDLAVRVLGNRAQHLEELFAHIRALCIGY